MPANKKHTYHPARYLLKTGIAMLTACLILTLTLSGCSSTDLEPVSEVKTLNAVGDFYPEDPNQVNFPVKVIFAIDDSGSMKGNDPQKLRIEAVRNFATEYLTDEHENAWINVYLWASEIREGTGVFTRDESLIDPVLNTAEKGNSTHYMKALTEMQNQIHSDILRTSTDDSRKSRMKYIGVFLSDGEPLDGLGKEAYLTKIEEIRTMVQKNGSSFVLNTYLLANGLDDIKRKEAESLLTDMALAGKGELTVLESAEDIDFVNSIDMTVSVQYRLKYFFACNLNARAGKERIHTDSDGDGLTDEDEERYGTDPGLKDTDDDGYSDYFEITRSTHNERYNPLIPDIPCEFYENGRYLDTDRDGLTDCEETYLTTNLDDIDTDQDFIPDDIEFIFGTNPLESEKLNDDDLDGIGNLREIQLHTNPSSDDPTIHERYSYNYELITQNQNDPEERAYEFHVSNIKTVNTKGSYWDATKRYNILAPGENRIRFYYCQLPEDSSNLDELIYRMAEIKVKYGEDVTERLSQFDFIRIQAPK